MHCHLDRLFKNCSIEAKKLTAAAFPFSRCLYLLCGGGGGGVLRSIWDAIKAAESDSLHAEVSARPTGQAATASFDWIWRGRPCENHSKIEQDCCDFLHPHYEKGDGGSLEYYETELRCPILSSSNTILSYLRWPNKNIYPDLERSRVGGGSSFSPHIGPPTRLPSFRAAFLPRYLIPLALQCREEGTDRFLLRGSRSHETKFHVLHPACPIGSSCSQSSQEMGIQQRLQMLGYPANM